MPTELKVQEKPILFSTPMVEAILEGRKTQTRRVYKPKLQIEQTVDDATFQSNLTKLIPEISPYHPGQRLWVRETWAPCPEYKPIPHPEKAPKVWYKADNNRPTWAGYDWRPSIFMPRWASRLTLEITEVKVQKLQDITIEDCLSEGINQHVASQLGYAVSPSEEAFNLTQAIPTYRTLWNHLNSKRGYSWDSNCWVWAINFKRIEK